MSLNTKQQQALEMVKNNQVNIITGAPGVGKTFALKAILDWARSENISFILAAPTGRAAKQMATATGCESATIHRTLEPRKTRYGFEFTRNSENLIDADMLILDETSMISTSLMASMLRAIDTKKTKIVFVGDAYQLPSIGGGAVLRDFLASGIIPFVELTEIQRNAGELVVSCHQIKDAKYYKPSDTLDLKKGKNIRHIECSRPESIQQIIKEIVCMRMPMRGYSQWDIQVLSPVNRRTILSCKDLNIMLQKELNKNDQIENYPFRVDDRVINIKNEKVACSDGSDTFLVNGDQGEILEIDTSGKRLIVKFFDPERFAALPMYGHNLLLSYAITVHRAQGSEYRVIVIPVHSSFGFFTTRSLLYTALSRAQDLAITIGQFSSIKKMIKQDESIKRRTMLKQKLLA